MKNNWYAITGAPSSGKTTVIDLLKDRGFNVVYEIARAYIDQEIKNGKKVEEIRRNEGSFQEEVLKLKIEAERNLSSEEIIFFDRGIPDSDAYYALNGIEKNDLLKKAIKDSQYRRVFLLDLLDYKKDYARTETQEEQINIHNLLEGSYKEIGTDIVKVPAMSPLKRLDFILGNL